VGVVFVIVWGLCLLLCGDCVCYCVGDVFVIVWGLCLLWCGGCVCYCVGVVFVIVWGSCLLLCGGCVCLCHFFFFGCSNLITYYGMNLVRFDVGASSGVV